MDPLSSLSIAAAAVQFVDYGTRILSDTCEVYSSATGHTSRHVELSVISQDLAVLANELESLSVKMQQPREGNAAEMLKRLCNDCREVNSEVEKILGKLQACGVSKFDLDKDSFLVAMERVSPSGNMKLASKRELAKNSVMVAIRAVLVDGKLKSLNRRMSRIRKQMTTAALVCLWYDIEQIHETFPSLLTSGLQGRSPGTGESCSSAFEAARGYDEDLWSDRRCR